MGLNVFEYSEYKQVLKAHIKANEASRGYQARLAKAAGCQSSFLSQALNSHVQLTPDHAAGLSAFWNFSDDETEYFMSLVSVARAANDAYKNILNKKLKILRAKNQDITNRVKLPTLTAIEQQVQYYSAWYWVALHLIVGIPQMQKLSNIAERLNLSEKLVETCLHSLEKMGLVQQKSGRWQPTQKAIHISKESSLINMHHLNWRNQAMQNIYKRDPDSLHYSTVHTLSLEDFDKLKNLLLNFIEQSKKIVGPSPEQEIICINLDCFKV